MNRLILVLLIFCIGCPKPAPKPTPPPPPAPLIQCDLYENVDGIEIKVNYFYHYNNNKAWVNVDLKNLEEVQKYKKQVEFLLTQLEDFEKRMTIHEQLKESNNGN